MLSEPSGILWFVVAAVYLPGLGLLLLAPALLATPWAAQAPVPPQAWVLLGLLIGGILAAPLGAWAAKHFPAKQMLILVGVVLTVTSAYGVWKAWG